MKIQSVSLLMAAGLQQARAIQLDVSSPGMTALFLSSSPAYWNSSDQSTASLRNASTALAYNLMTYYKNNQSSTATTAIGTLPAPLYWWEAGAVWGGMIDYWAYTNDTSYNPTITQALLAQVGPDNNYMPPAYYASLGNDDQAFWALAVLAAVEYGYPEGPTGSPSWLSLAEAVFNTMVPRWDTTTCAGGLRWQVFASNAGYNYKNSISNGGFFQIASRLAHYTGNSTYYDWAEKIWDWTVSIGLIDKNYAIYDGTDDTINCTQVDHTLWSYNEGMFIYGTAILYNYTNASTIWQDRTTGLLQAANRTFFSPYKNASNIMFETACELTNNCNNDQYSFKAYLARWLAKTSIVAPYTAPAIHTLLVASAEAAAKSCSGGTDGVTCGEKWYTGGYDGNYGVGQQLSALEVTQALLIANAPKLRTGPEVSIQGAPTTTLNLNSATPTSTSGSGVAPAAASASASGQAGKNSANSGALGFRGHGYGRHGVRALVAAAAGLALGSFCFEAI